MVLLLIISKFVELILRIRLLLPCLLCDRLGLASPIVAGQSWGGNVVLTLAARHGGVAGIALVDGGWIHLSDRFPTFEECWEQLEPPVFDGWTRASLEERARSWNSDWPEEGRLGALANFGDLPDGTVVWRTCQGDGDGDGVGCLGDCNDDDGDVFPGAPDPCEDGVDSDCDGTNEVFYRDADEDGFGTAARFCDRQRYALSIFDVDVRKHHRSAFRCKTLRNCGARRAGSPK